MPRGPVVFSLPAGTTPQVPNTTIASATWNTAMDDIAQTFNTPQPIQYGGTNATTAASARVNLGAQANLGYTPVNQGGDTMLGTLVLVGTGTSTYQLSNTATVTLANGTAILLSNFSGMVIINTINGGGISLWLVGGGFVLKVAETISFGVAAVYDAGNNRYGFLNSSGSSRTFSMTCIRTRETA